MGVGMVHANNYPIKERGYTILELSITLSIVAILLTGGLMTFNNYTQQKRLDITSEKLHTIEQALAQFVTLNGYLPCPARFDVLDTDSEFGTASSYNTTTYACTTITNNTGTIPVNALKLPADYIYDGWNRKFTYRIATAMGHRRHFAADLIGEDIFPGDIHISDLHGTSKTHYASSHPEGAAYVIISHGANGLGAWHKASTETPGTDINDLEAENINHSINARYIQAPLSPTFDDIVVFKTKKSLTHKPTISPLILSDVTCQNAANIVHDGDPTLYSNDLSDYATLYSATSLMSHVYDVALHMVELCNNPPTIPAPQRVAGLRLWLDAQDYDTFFPDIDTAISEWRDKSPYAHDLEQSTGVNQPTHTLVSSGRSVVTFDSNEFLTSEKLFGSDIFGSDQATFFFVLADPSSTLNDTFFEWNNTNHYVRFDMLASNIPRVTFTDASSFAGVNNGTAITSLSLITAIKDNGTNTLSLTTYGGNTGNSANSAELDLNNALTLVLGSDASFTNGWSGTIGEVIVYNRALSTTEQQDIQQYLIDKWGL